MTATGLYVYGLIPASAAALSIAAKPVMNPAAAVEILTVGDISALQSPIDADEILPVRRNLMAHTKVLEEAMACTTLLPMQFGVMVPDQAHLARLIEVNRESVLRILATLTGKIEVGLKVRWNEATIFSEIATETPTLRDQGRKLNQKNEQESYYDRIALGQKVEAILQVKKQSDFDLFSECLAEFDCQIKHLASMDDYSVLNSAILIDKAREETLFDQINDINRDCDNRFDIKFISPVPAYNFVSERLNLGAQAA